MQVGRPGGKAISQENAAVQQASLELLRHAHYLYKSGVARLPTAASRTGSLGRLDELLVRSFSLPLNRRVPLCWPLAALLLLPNAVQLGTVLSSWLQNSALARVQFQLLHWRQQAA